MEDRTISMGGAAWSALRIASFSKDEFVEEEMKGWAYIDKEPEIRRELFAQVYDLACPVITKPRKRITKESIEDDLG